MSFSPIVLFTYNRLKNTQETVSCLLANREAAASDLIVYSDAPKQAQAADAVRQVREYLRTVTGFRSVTLVERTQNYGLVKNITEGVTETVNRYGRVIVLEDDHSVSPCFLQYMNEGLDRLADREEIASIHGYMYPHRQTLPEAFLVKGADCWGWATWKRAWDLFDSDAARLSREIVRRGLQAEFDFGGTYPFLRMLQEQAEGKAGSWAVCWYASAFLAGKYTVYPGESLVRVNSLAEGGEHGGTARFLKKYLAPVRQQPIDWALAETDGESLAGRQAIERFFRSLRSPLQRVRGRMAGLFNKENCP